MTSSVRSGRVDETKDRFGVLRSTVWQNQRRRIVVCLVRVRWEVFDGRCCRWEKSLVSNFLDEESV